MAALTVVGASAAVIAGTTTAASAASGDGSLTVQVVRDVAGTGSYNSLIDLPLSGVTVRVTDKFGTSVSLTTDAAGDATLPANDPRLTGGAYRVDVVNPQPGTMWPALIKPANPATTPSATVLSSNTEFVDVSGGHNVTLTTGFWYPHDYCQSNPMVANACQPATYAHGNNNPQLGARTTVFTTPYEGDNASNPSGGSFGTTGYSDSNNVSGFKVQSDSTKTGAVYGIAYNRESKMIFAAAYAKRNTTFGPAGPGGIYIINPATGATSVFTTVPDAAPAADLVGPAFGHDIVPSTGNIATDEDIQFVSKVGKESLGAMMISDDYKKLFVVNEYNKRVYVYDTSTAVLLGTIDISANPGCAASDDWRPMGLGTNQGTLYVGGVCSGEVEAAAAHPQNWYPGTLKAIVLTYSQNTYAPLNGGQPILDQSLNFNKGDHQGPNSVCSGSYGGWMAWNDASWCANTATATSSEPMLCKILVEANGNLDLGFRDRFGDQTGKNLAMPVVNNGGGPTQYTRFSTGGPVAEGDTNLACPDGSGMFVMDVNGGCGIAPVAAGQQVNHYYNVQGKSPHPRSMFAGMTLSYSEPGLIQDQVDATSTYNSQGLSVLDRRGAGHADPYNQLIVDASYPSSQAGAQNGVNDLNGASFGKGQGLADMDVLCDLAPIQIGNHVWYNTAADGHQNAGEAPVVGATVNLYDKVGNLVATTTTNQNGDYSFDSLTTPGLKTLTDYVIKMDNPSDYAAGGPLANWSLSKTTTGPDGNPASTGADGYPTISMKTGDHGQNNDDYDFGFTQKPKIHIVKFDGRLSAPINPQGTLGHDDNVKSPTVYQVGSNGTTGPEPVKMVVTNNGGTPLIDVKVTDQTLSAPTMTGLSCDFSALGGPTSGTTWAGPLAIGASFPCTGSINLKAGQKHGDQINVIGTQADPNTGLAIKDAQGNPVTVADADRYYAFAGVQNKIVIDKRDAKTGTESDTRAAAFGFKAGETRTIAMPATNVGTTPVHNVVITDTTLSGAKVTNLTCVTPTGQTLKAGANNKVTWSATFGANPTALWMPGDTIACTGQLTMASGAQIHGDRIAVDGVGSTGNNLHADNPFWAKVTGPKVPTLPNTGAGGTTPTLPDTGGPSIGWWFTGGAALIAGFVLMINGRRRWTVK